MATGLETYGWDGEGYRPLVFSSDWQVAILNWEPAADPARLGKVERHVGTDEVFVLLRGRAVLFTWSDAGEFALVEAAPGVVYNVTAGTWHSVITTTGASWIIVEARDTHLHGTEMRPMTPGERAELLGRLPAWAQPA
ncbi:MAG TPA: hypothetical protein PLJ35_04870 [Anaerolineae bacterium]|nr:hypothetical protein [Anaerolineae bacterium]HPL29078.1 hypothetical protein [Anaerolineae bacterium]